MGAGKEKELVQSVAYCDFFGISYKQIVPALQRPYVWKNKQIGQLWEDVVSNDEGYFVGVVVLVPAKGSAKPEEIIDGQQRLVTLSLMLCVLRDKILLRRGKESKRIAEEINHLLYFDGSPRISFSDAVANASYTKLLSSDLNFSQKAELPYLSLSEAYKFIFEKIGRANSKEEKKFFNRLKALTLVPVSCESHSLAYKFFESLNATAVSLASIDLIKNRLFQRLSSLGANEDLKAAEAQWSALDGRFNKRTLLKSFVRHHWISTGDYTSHAALFDKFVAKYGRAERKTVLSYVQEINAESIIYLALRDAKLDDLSRLNIRKRNHLNSVKETLQFLSFLGVDQVYSVLLFIYRQHPKKFPKELVRLASFQFLSKYIPGSPSDTESVFADFCKTGDFDDMHKKLLKMCSNREEQFIEDFLDRARYVEKRSGDIQFVLEKHFLSKRARDTFRNPTIEHILPKKPSQNYLNELLAFFGSKPEYDKEKNKIGNLTILEECENSSKDVSNLPFSSKTNSYTESGRKAHLEIMDFDFFNDPKSSIVFRGQKIAREIYGTFIKSLETGKF